jgi:hypothetical protein
MRMLRKNLAADGDDYLETLFGWGWTPGIASSGAKRNRDTYETWIERLVGYISTPAVGYWILGSIVSVVKHQCVIKPWIAPKPTSGYHPPWDVQDPSNAYVTPSSWADASKQGDLVYREEHERSTGRTEYEEIVGTGQGADAVVRMTPWFLPSLDYRRSQPGAAPDEVLFHELVHALDDMTAQNANYQTAPKGMDNMAEFAAVLFSNLYSSQTKRDLRANHKDFQKLEEDLCDSKKFFDKYRDQVLAVRNRHRQLAGIFSSWDEGFLRFNPFRIAAVEAP